MLLFQFIEVYFFSGIFGISHAETPVIVERNCTHVTFAIETQSRNEGFFYMFEDGIPTVR